MQLPDAIERRNILYGEKATAEQRINLGDAYLAAGRQLDALEFYARAEHQPGIAKIREVAVAEGNTFLAARLEQLGLPGLSPEQWQSLADNAASRGLELYAEKARKRAEAGASSA